MEIRLTGNCVTVVQVKVITTVRRSTGQTVVSPSFVVRPAAAVLTHVTRHATTSIVQGI